ncbi:MAG TPA: hypothetical protein VJN02_01090 [Gammaproteobacteria bacterium]|nr:hypothetical protein [Gammaproteobacteria bacterium]
MKGYTVTVKDYKTWIVIDEQAFEWINSAEQEQANLILGIARKFNGDEYHEKNIYIKVVFKISEFEDYLQGIKKNYRENNQITSAIDSAIYGEKPQEQAHQYRLYFAQGYHRDTENVFVIEESVTADICIGNLSIQRDINIEPMTHVDGDSCAKLFSPAFSTETIEKIKRDYEETWHQALAKIEIFPQKVLEALIETANCFIANGDTNEQAGAKIKVLALYPDPPIIVDDDNYQSNIPLIEKRFNFPKGQLKKIENEAFAISKQFAVNIQEAKNNYIREIEVKLDSLQTRLRTISNHSIFTKNGNDFISLSNIKTKTLSLYNDIHILYEPLKNQLMAISGSQENFITRINNILNQLKQDLYSYEYGNQLAIINYVKECFIVVLYNADFLNDLLQINSIAQANNIYGQLPLDVLATFVIGPLRIKGDFSYLDTTAAQSILEKLEEVRKRLEKTMGFYPFDVSKARFTSKPKKLTFTPQMLRYVMSASQIKPSFSKDISDKLNDDFEECRAVNVESFIASDIKDQLIKIQDLLSSTIANVDAFQRFIDNVDNFITVYQLVTGNIGFIDHLISSIQRTYNEINECLNLNEVNLPEQIKQDFMKIVDALDEETKQLLTIHNENIGEFNELNRSFILFTTSSFLNGERFDDNIKMPKSLKDREVRLSGVEQLVKKIEDIETQLSTLQDEIASRFSVVGQLAKKFENTKTQLSTLQDEISYSHQLISNLIQSNKLIQEANTLAQASYQPEAGLTVISVLQGQATQFYSGNIQKINELEEVIKNFRKISNNTFQAIEKAIEKDIENKILEKFNLFRSLIEQQQKNYSTKLVCHLIVRAILFCYQEFAKKTTQKQGENNHSLDQIILDESHQGWCVDDAKSLDLLRTVQLHLSQQVKKNRTPLILALHRIIQELDIDHISDESIKNLLEKFVAEGCCGTQRLCLFDQQELNDSRVQLECRHVSGRNNGQAADVQYPEVPKIETVSIFNQERNPFNNHTCRVHVIKSKQKKEGFFKRHWGKILFGLMIAAIAVGGILTAGAVPTIAAGILTLAAPTVFMSPVLAAGLGITGVAMGGAVVGVSMAAIGKKLITHKEDGAVGFFKRNWGKMGLVCLVAGAMIAATLFTFGGSLLMGMLTAGVVTSIAAMGFTVNTGIAAGVGAGTLGVGLIMGSVVFGVMTGIISDYCGCVPSKKNPYPRAQHHQTTPSPEDTQPNSSDCYVGKQLGHFKNPSTSVPGQRIHHRRKQPLRASIVSIGECGFSTGKGHEFQANTRGVYPRGYS